MTTMATIAIGKPSFGAAGRCGGRPRPGPPVRPSWPMMPFPWVRSPYRPEPARLAESASPQLGEEVLVGRGDRRRRRPALDEAPGRRAPMRSRPRRDRRAAWHALVNASGRRAARPARRRPARPCGPPRCRGRRWPRSGRPAARIEYSFDGTLDRARPRRSGTTWTSAAASTSGSRSLGCMSTKRTLASPAACRSRSGRAEPPPLITNTTSGSCAQVRPRRRAAGRATARSPTLPAYITTRLAGEAVLAPVGVLRSARAGSARCRRSSG